MKLKEGVGVKVTGMLPEILLAIMITQALYIEWKYTDFVITSIKDGVHMKDSLHYSGKAFDFRFWNIPDIMRSRFVQELKVRLGQDYDVVLEVDHIHVEFDPK